MGPGAAISDRAAPAALLMVALAIVLAGCGEDGEPAGTTVTEPAGLTPAQTRVITDTQAAVDRYCLKVASAVANGSSPRVADYERVVAALDALAALARETPDGVGPAGVSPRLALGDLAENLEGSNCDSRLVGHIDEALGTIGSE